MDLASLPIGELEKRIIAGSDDAIDCINAAETLIRRDTASSGETDDFATAVFNLWRQGKIAISTDRDGGLRYRIPYVQ